MTTCREIITLGLTMAKVPSLGSDPKAKESKIGLELLQGMYDSMFADGLFGTLTDVYADGDYTAEENQRIIADNSIITIPDTIYQDGDTRTPRDLSALVVITNTTELHYVFSGGRWETAHALTLDSVAPLASRGKLGLAAMFASVYIEAFGERPLGPQTTRRAFMFQQSLMFKFGSTKNASVSDYY